MAIHHQPELIDFAAPPNVMPTMEAPPPPGFLNDGLLALQLVDDMPAGGGGVLAGDAPRPWPPTAASLSLFDYSMTGAGAGASLVGHHQPLMSVAPPDHQLQLQHQQPLLFRLRSSKYLGPVKELLTEFCSLEGDFHTMADKQRAPKSASGGKWDDDVEAMSSGLWGSSPSLSSMDLLDLERRKARLLSMVEEVDRRYRRYREQMRSVEVSFEAVAGGGAAQVYTRLARRAMSRHFRCLRDALVAQVRALKKAMGERDAGGGAAPGATKGDTPRLRVLDQCLRQQRAFHQPAGGAMDNNYPWRPQRGLPERAVAVLRAWLFEHFLHPYPNDVDKHILARQTGLSRSQVSNWFINARARLWKPMIEDMYKEEVNQQSSSSVQNNQQISSNGVKAERSTSSAVLQQQQQQIHSVVGNPLFHHHGGGYPKNMTTMQGVSLTLGLQQQQPFAPSMSMMMMHHQQRAAGLGVWDKGEEQLTMTESCMVPYI